MTVKVLVTAIGQQIIADTKQIENKETNEIVGYWMAQPRVIQYQQNEEGQVGVNFGPYCFVSDESEFSLRGDHVVAILEPREDVMAAYNAQAFPETPDVNVDATGDPTEAEAFAQEAVEPKAQEGIAPAPAPAPEETVAPIGVDSVSPVEGTVPV